MHILDRLLALSNLTRRAVQQEFLKRAFNVKRQSKQKVRSCKIENLTLVAALVNNPQGEGDGDGEGLLLMPFTTPYLPSHSL